MDILVTDKKPAGEKRPFPKWLPVVIPLIVAVGAGAAALYYYTKYNELSKNAAQEEPPPRDETKALIERVGRLLVLPEGEQPTIATVTDPERLKDQPFFAKAKQGFKVLIFTNSKKAILYDPELDKIVEVAPLNIGSTAGVTSPQGTVTEPPLSQP